jgi:hypothetical protein
MGSAHTVAEDFWGLYTLAQEKPYFLIVKIRIYL